MHGRLAIMQMRKCATCAQNKGTISQIPLLLVNFFMKQKQEMRNQRPTVVHLGHAALYFKYYLNRTRERDRMAKNHVSKYREYRPVV